MAAVVWRVPLSQCYVEDPGVWRVLLCRDS